MWPLERIFCVDIRTVFLFSLFVQVSSTLAGFLPWQLATISSAAQHLAASCDVFQRAEELQCDSLDSGYSGLRVKDKGFTALSSAVEHKYLHCYM